ncbi:MFS transporter [Candidatus Desulforudis audaxviator]|uniref:Major facilitator superfamily MFS_1 n=1 Tax=Desulforudis audaxviator (strain MP104C) TaxID=477974 RepID=B1I1V1_DESAP|nr:MFS transporter [Candidatus Desulforudis audaxviator]ACA59022.1 major facilitator superfamily MFS_1 [Candidatus Desulforudis audaxviator MP104C]AZK59068.1 MFS permease [Candidatus Desulforudis audaxviator]
MSLEPSPAEVLQRQTAPAPRKRARPLAALRHRNFRIYWLGQAVSLVGTWIQNVALAWLVLELTGSPLLLGLVGAAQFTPILLFSLLGGVIADRMAKRRLIIGTQSVLMLVAYTLGFLTVTGLVQYWHVLLLAVVVGLANAMDIPARQSFLIELAGREDLMNAIALHSSIFNVARFVGPAAGGLLIAGFSLPVCFFVNGLSFTAVLASLFMIRTAGPPPADRTFTKVWPEIGEGFNYIRSTPTVLYPIILMAVLSLFTFNFNVLVPVYAREVLHQEAQGFGFLMAAHGLGSLGGAFYLAMISHRGPRAEVLLGGALGVCLAHLALAFTGWFWLALPVLALGGLSMMVFAGLVNTTVQLAAPDRLRGRVMSVYSLVFLGMMPLGNLMAGAVAHHWDAPAAFGFGAVLGLCGLALLSKKVPCATASAEPSGPVAPSAFTGSGASPACTDPTAPVAPTVSVTATAAIAPDSQPEEPAK